MRILNSHLRAPLLLSVLFFCGVTGSAQETQEKTAPSPPSGLALEINTKEGPVGHQSVPGSFFGGRYRRLPSWQPPAGVPQPRTFKLITQIEGGAVRSKVFALMDRFHEQEILLGDYLLREGEKAVVEGMEKYGYEPMELTVVRIKSAPPVLPTASSRIPSVAVVKVEAKGGNFPTYKVTLQNLSHKSITHLEVKTFADGRLATTRWPRAEQNRLLMRSGETYEVEVSDGGGGSQAPDGYIPSSPQSIEIVMAVFDDKSYEGDARSAANALALLRGQKIQTTRALALIERASAAEPADKRAALENFEKQVTALSRDAQLSAAEELAAEFPDLAPKANAALKFLIEGGLDQVREALLKDIREYAQAGERGAEGQRFGTWLGGLKQKYESWLSRL